MMAFEAKEVVWAKVDGYPWWPALVTKAPKCQGENYRINFFGEKQFAYVSGKNLAKYEQMYEQHANARGKNHVPQKCIIEADNYIKQNKALKRMDSTGEMEPPRRGRGSRKLKHSASEVQEEASEKKQEPSEGNQETLVLFGCEILEVDFKKINQVEDQWKELLEMFIEGKGSAELRKEAVAMVRKFNFSALNDEELLKTRIPNRVKHMENICRESGDRELSLYLSDLFESLKARIVSYLSSTEYYEHFLSISYEEEEEKSESAESTTNFEDKVFDLLKRNYHFKKDNARVLSDRIGRHLEDWVSMKKCQIIRDLKDKAADLKPGRREHITEEEIESCLEKIMNDS